MDGNIGNYGIGAGNSDTTVRFITSFYLRNIWARLRGGGIKVVEVAKDPTLNNNDVGRGFRN